MSGKYAPCMQQDCYNISPIEGYNKASWSEMSALRLDPSDARLVHQDARPERRDDRLERTIGNNR